MTPTATERDRLLENVMSRHHYAGDALIEILHAAQQLYGYLSPALLHTIAHKLRLPPSRVLGVATFYHLFRFLPPPSTPRPCASGQPVMWRAPQPSQTLCEAAAGRSKWIAAPAHAVWLRWWSAMGCRCHASRPVNSKAICGVPNDRRIAPPGSAVRKSPRRGAQGSHPLLHRGRMSLGRRPRGPQSADR